MRHSPDYSWNIKRPIPEAIIEKLEQRWPDVILSVDAHNHPITDKRSLYSPLLHSLSFCILNHTATVTATSQLEQYSKLPELREVLLRSPNLRKLDIKFEYNWMSRQVEWSGITASPHVLNMPLEPSDRLPPLQEFTFSGPPETYEFTLEHCQLWKQCMDWSRLRRLDLGISCPQHFFKHFGNSLTSLKSLTMGVRFGDRHYTHWAQGPLTCDGVLVVENFIRCIPHLHELNITDFSSAFAEIFHLIGTRHRTLRKLYYHASINRTQRQHGNPDAVYWWTAREITKLPELRELTIDFLLLDGRWVCISWPFGGGGLIMISK